MIIFNFTFLSLRAAPRVLPQIQPHNVPPHIFVKVGPNFHCPNPKEEIGNNALSCQAKKILFYIEVQEAMDSFARPD